jgi:hypothetical protein
VAEKVTGKDLKELRKPDEFQLVAGRAMDFIIAHQRQILLVVAGAVLIVVVAWATTALRQRSEAKAGEELAQALRVAARPVAGEGFAPPGEETFPNRAERTKASVAAFEKVRKEHGGSTAAQTATLQQGLVQQQAGDAAAAVPLLEEFLKSAPENHPMRATALETLGYAQEAQGKLGEASTTFAKMAAAGAPERSAYQVARIALLEGKPGAKDQLAAVAKEFTKEPVALEANLRLEVASLPPKPAAAPAPAEK